MANKTVQELLEWLTNHRAVLKQDLNKKTSQLLHVLARVKGGNWEGMNVETSLFISV